MPTSYNRAAAFVEFCKGTPIDEIAHALAIPIEHLMRWKREEKWDQLANAATKHAKDEAALALTTGALGLAATTTGERGLEKIKENRERNMEIALKLQGDLLKTVTLLAEGKLQAERVFANGLRLKVDPTLRDRCDLALYAKNVAELSYRALGDSEGVRNTPPEGGALTAGQITIVLPAPIAEPRSLRAYDVEVEALVSKVPNT